MRSMIQEYLDCMATGLPPSDAIVASKMIAINAYGVETSSIIVGFTGKGKAEIEKWCKLEMEVRRS